MTNCATPVIHVVFLVYYMCITHVFYMYHPCISTCAILVQAIHLYYMCEMCITSVLHMYYRCDLHVYYTKSHIFMLYYGLFSRDLHILDLQWRLPLCSLLCLWILPLCALLLCSMTHYDITMAHDIGRIPHCGTTMGNDVARDIHCDTTIDNDIAMCT